jgi:hypothetical protein
MAFNGLVSDLAGNEVGVVFHANLFTLAPIISLPPAFLLLQRDHSAFSHPRFT